MLAEIPSHSHRQPEAPHVSLCGRPAGNRGALMSYCTCTRRHHAHHASFWIASWLFHSCVWFLRFILAVVFTLMFRWSSYRRNRPRSVIRNEASSLAFLSKLTAAGFLTVEEAQARPALPHRHDAPAFLPASRRT